MISAMLNLPAATMVLDSSPAGKEGRRSVHKHNLPGCSLDAHQVWACHNQALYTSVARRARGLRCSPNTSLMAICGHYSSPVSHTHAYECRLCSSRATIVAFSTILPPPPLLVVVAYCGCCYWCLFSHSTPSNTPYWPTSTPAVMLGVVYLPARWLRYTHTRTHAKFELSNGGSSHAVSPHRVYPFHSGSIPRSYSTSLLFSSFNLSLSLSLPSH